MKTITINIDEFEAIEKLIAVVRDYQEHNGSWVTVGQVLDNLDKVRNTHTNIKDDNQRSLF